MYRRILVPLDGSSNAEHALQLAASFAHSQGTTLFLVHVHSVIMPVKVGVLTVGEIPVTDELWDRERRQQEQCYLDSQAQRVAPLAACPIVEVVLDGSTPDALSHYVEQAKIDLVVMTTHGHGGWSLPWLGSMAEAFIHASHVPLLLVRQQDKASTLKRSTKRVLLLLDGSACAEQIIEPALRLFEPSEAEYTVVRVVEQLTVPRFPGLAFAAAAAQEATDSLAEDARVYLEGIARRLRDRNVRFKTELILHDHPAQCILNYARESETDIIVVATRGHGGITHHWLGSVSDKIVRGADRPVLLIRPERTPDCP